ncbi:hypothetical protein [Aliikangiella sp. G2MR2-5]|uniref:hypothetical protein n=1 Tax=Aliikangiella sp. G2MR2-5 TaxID=2788943 RepID=UPI0018AC300F|nr:hypothetical protein [Aliikangiella sp. G2MR2-5]
MVKFLQQISSKSVAFDGNSPSIISWRFAAKPENNSFEDLNSSIAATITGTTMITGTTIGRTVTG